jgi:diguanylate cyclase (GGDEF)-like protein/PAS domain S-box-containing protein
MNLATFLIPPSLDAKQALRLRRFGLAALTYALSTGLVTVAWAFGVLPAAAALEIGVVFLALNLGLYTAIRSGFNLRFGDPSLTSFQILAAITVLMYIVYHMDDGRNIALFGCFVVFQFGIFRLNSREFTGITLYTLAAYALVLNLLMHLRPEAIQSVPKEWMSWLLLAGFLPVFTIVGGQINKLRRRLRASEARFRSLTEMSSDFYWESDAEHRLTRGSADKKASTYLKFRRGAQFGERIWEIPCLSPDEAGWRAHRVVRDAHQTFRAFEFSRLGTDGAERTISISGDPVFDAFGAFQGYHGVGTDITERRRAERALRDTADKLRLFVDNVPAMTAYWDENQRCGFASNAFSAFYGPAVEDLIGKHIREALGDAVYREVEGHLLQALEGHAVSYQRTDTRQGGESRHLEVRLLPHIGGQGKVLGYFSVTTDITEHKLAELRMQRVAHHDGLTGLPNQLLFNDRLDQTISLAKRDSREFALLYLDLDKFKPVNDALGHAAGDELLKAVATRIRREVRESDTVARVGGDEFIVILPDIDSREDAESVARKIIAALAAPFQLGSQKQSVDIGTSIGIAVYPADARDAEALVRAADAAMYRAKQAGRPLRGEAVTDEARDEVMVRDGVTVVTRIDQLKG